MSHLTTVPPGSTHNVLHTMSAHFTLGQVGQSELKHIDCFYCSTSSFQTHFGSMHRFAPGPHVLKIYNNKSLLNIFPLPLHYFCLVGPYSSKSSFSIFLPFFRSELILGPCPAHLLFAPSSTSQPSPWCHVCHLLFKIPPMTRTREQTGALSRFHR